MIFSDAKLVSHFNFTGLIRKVDHSIVKNWASLKREVIQRNLKAKRILESFVCRCRCRCQVQERRLSELAGVPP